jgi:hypothetical protein
MCPSFWDNVIERYNDKGRNRPVIKGQSMKPDLSLARRATVVSCFEDCVLALFLRGHQSAVFELGTLRMLEPGDTLLGQTATGYGLHIVLDGQLTGPEGWYGPGNHLTLTQSAQEGEYGANDMQTLVWTLDLGASAWREGASRELKRAVTSAIIAAETAERASALPEPLPCPTSLCDIDHPELLRVAARLRRTTRASTAEAILRFVQPMPYRFGPWQERASDTLARGIGMCTTKANLQVALMRICGLEAGFAEIAMPTSQLGQLMPDAWRRMQRPVVRHYFAAVKLGGRWHAADASNDDVPAQIMAAALPEVAEAFELVLDEGRPFSPQIAASGKDPFAITVVPDLSDVMGKTSRFAPRHFQAMNTRLDRARGVGAHADEGATDATMRGEGSPA